MRLQYSGFKNIYDLPNSCINNGNSTSGFIPACNSSFKNNKNLIQDTDGFIYILVNQIIQHLSMDLCVQVTLLFAYKLDEISMFSSLCLALLLLSFYATGVVDFFS